ncbi:hypothetical protein PI95_008540 [Hassallia byssoidea VB512170]|uniref:Uncharacterized protein n=1 Tax=Hassallia byssoidea VB512170 TaxID=1304833 RepID=A0A846H7K2_9CYAN|nr:hypothetical protein [Hassalia byssoidea VB512170]
MPNFEYSSKKARALSTQVARKPRPSRAISPVELPVKAVVENAIALKV